jgi:hypothetical protein
MLVTEAIGATLEELCFLMVPAEGIKGGQLEQVKKVVGYSPDSNGVSVEAVESPLLEAVTRERLMT